MSRIYFFATPNDIVSILESAENNFPIKYVEENMLANQTPQIWQHITELPSLGYASGSQEIACDPYLLMEKEANVVVVSSVMMDGEFRFDVYQNNNPDSILVRLGGFWKDGSLISGHFIASSDQKFPQNLMNHIRLKLKKNFTRIQGFWVGPEAYIHLRSGKRLCTAIQSPPEYDLREPLPITTDAN